MDAKSNVSPASNQDTGAKSNPKNDTAANKRRQKQQTKTTEAHQRASSEDDYDLSSHEEEPSDPSTSLAGQNLTKKKLEYLKQQIRDKNGVFCYEDDPERYKKARKRLQNRESAVRSRQKKRDEVEELEQIVRTLQQEKAAMEALNAELKRQNEYFMGMLGN
jgi:anti-sigma28 factor (negative regulator of flagellin synthesis)